MATHVIFNGKEITNPVLKTLASVVAVSMAGLSAAGMVFVVLPLIGITISLAVSLLVVLLLGLVFAIPVILFGSAILGFILLPFMILKDMLTRTRHK